MKNDVSSRDPLITASSFLHYDNSHSKTFLYHQNVDERSLTFKNARMLKSAIALNRNAFSSNYTHD